MSRQMTPGLSKRRTALRMAPFAGQSPVALVHDYLTQSGGAERVVLALANALGVQVIYTTAYVPGRTHPDLCDYRVVDTWLSALARHTDIRLLAPLIPAAIRSIDIGSAPLAVCSTSGWAHATSAPFKLAYCYTPPRWLYEPQDYFATQRSAKAFEALSGLVRQWDMQHAQTVTRYVAISSVIANRIRQAYGRQTTVITPPLSIDVSGPLEPVSALQGQVFALVVSRPRTYKRVDVAVDACRRAGVLSVVVGHRDPSLGSDGVLQLGRVSEGALRWLYSEAQCLVSAAKEDFGLTPLEANAFGTPAVTPSYGGFADTMVSGINGLTFESDEEMPDSISDTVAREWDPEVVRGHAQRFTVDAFRSRLLDECRLAREGVRL